MFRIPNRMGALLRTLYKARGFVIRCLHRMGSFWRCLLGMSVLDRSRAMRSKCRWDAEFRERRKGSKTLFSKHQGIKSSDFSIRTNLDRICNSLVLACYGLWLGFMARNSQKELQKGVQETRKTKQFKARSDR